MPVSAGPGPLHPRLIRSTVAAAALALASGCVDNRVVEPEIQTGPDIAQALALDPSQPGVLLDPRPSVPERIAEIRLPDGIVERLIQPSDPELNQAVEASDGVALVGLKPAQAARTHVTGIVPAITRDQMLLSHRRIEAVGGEIVRTFASLPLVVAVLPPGAASRLLEFDEINYVEPNRTGRAAGGVHRMLGKSANTAMSVQDTTWGLHIIRAPIAWAENHVGHNATITFLDTGVDLTHVNSGDGPVRLTTCMIGDPVFSDCFDDVPHGSHIAGLAAARDNTEGSLGVMHYEGSPAAPSLASVKVCGPELQGCNYETVVAGLDWTITNGRQRQVVNMSLGFDTSAVSLATAVTQSVTAGNLLIAAAGVAGEDVAFPAAYSNVVAVSGTLDDDTFADTCPISGTGSSHGTEIDVSAPIWGLSMGLDGDYFLACGTSVSAAYASGVAALIWSEYPGWSAAQVRSRLESSARDLGTSGWDQYFGHGRVDAAAAVGIAWPSVTVDGPLGIDTTGVYEWTAQPTGGLGSYTFEWFWQIDFQTPTCNYQTSWVSVGDDEDFFETLVSESDYDFRLRVDIDSHGESASGGVKVYVGDGSQECPT